MNEFQKQLDAVKSAIKEVITSDMSDEQLKVFASLDNKLDTLNETHEKVFNAYNSMKDNYIDLLKHQATTTKASDDSSQEQTKGVTFKELLQKQRKEK